MAILLKKGRSLIPATVDALPIYAEVVPVDGQFDAKLFVGDILIKNAIFDTEADAATHADDFLDDMCTRLIDGGVTIIVIDDSDF